MFKVWRDVAEERIMESMRKGEFDGLRGTGRPLVFEDDSMVPEELRMAYKMLRNAGYVPDEVARRKEIQSALDLLEECRDEREIYRLMRRINGMIQSLNMRRNTRIDLEEKDQYFQRLVERMASAGKNGLVRD